MVDFKMVSLAALKFICLYPVQRWKQNHCKD